jgi:ABC-2 type transport system permease protein
MSAIVTTPARTTSQPAARAVQASVPIRAALTQISALAWRALVKMRRSPEQLVDVTFMPVLFTVMFGLMFGGAVAGSRASYLPILIPGIIAMTTITASVAAGVQLREDMDKGVFDRFKALPIARIAPLSGALLADTIRYGIASALTYAMGYLIGYRPGAGLGGVIAGALLAIVFAWSISWIFAFFGVIARSASSVQGISMLLLFPLTFLSNAFVPVETMPDWLQWFVHVNPVSHVVTAIRMLGNTGTIGPDFWWSLLGAAAIVAVFAPLTVRAYMRKA